MDFEDRGRGDVRERAIVEISVGLGVDEVQHAQIVEVQRGLPTHEHREVVVIETAIPYVDARERPTNELCLAGGRKLDAGESIRDRIDTIRHREVPDELPNDVCHGCRRYIVHMALVWQGELVGNDDAVNATLLQRVKVAFGVLDDGRDRPASVTVAWVTRQGIEVEHRYDGLLSTEHLVCPKHGTSPIYHGMGRMERPIIRKVCA